MEKYIIAIDGFAGTGKGTAAKSLAEKLNILCIDSGAIYRAGGYYACKNNISMDEQSIEKMLREIDIELKIIENKQFVYINGKNMNEYLRTMEANEYSSKIAAIGVYRSKVTEILRKVSNENSIIMEGRDIGTVIFPNADVKFFFEASVEERVKRRKLEYEKKGENISEEILRQNIIERDERDSKRDVAPLKKTSEYITVDTSNMSIDEVGNILYSIVKEKVGL